VEIELQILNQVETFDIQSTDQPPQMLTQFVFLVYFQDFWQVEVF
jgi:hypothetical protein